MKRKMFSVFSGEAVFRGDIGPWAMPFPFGIGDGVSGVCNSGDSFAAL